MLYTFACYRWFSIYWVISTQQKQHQSAIAISKMFNLPTFSTQLPTTLILPSSEPATPASALPNTPASKFVKYKALHKSMKR